LDQLLRIRTPVRIVTTRAGDLTFAIWHVRRALELCFPHLMALQAQFRLRLLCTVQIGERRIESRISRELYALWAVPGMTIDAGHRPRLVGASFPEQPFALLMAGETGFVLFANRVWRISGKTDRNGFFSTAGLEMSSAGTVTRLASEPLLV